MQRTWPILLMIGAVACGGDSPEPPAPPPSAPPPESSPIPLLPEKLEVSIEPAEPPAEPVDAPGVELARKLTQQFYRGELPQLHDRFSPEMKASMSVDHLRRMHEHMKATYGKETRVLEERSATKQVTDATTGQNQEYRGLVRWARFEKHDGVIEVLWILRPDDTVAGFFLRPATPANPKTG